MINDTRGGVEIVVVWTPGTASALDAARVSSAQDVGAAAVFQWELDGRSLTFRANPDDPLTFQDAETETLWDIFGTAIEGPLEGEKLQSLVHGSISGSPGPPSFRIRTS